MLRADKFWRASSRVGSVECRSTGDDFLLNRCSLKQVLVSSIRKNCKLKRRMHSTY